MDGIKAVIDTTVSIMQTEIRFGTFHFSFFQVFCAFFAISIIGNFIFSVFESGDD